MKSGHGHSHSSHSDARPAPPTALVTHPSVERWYQHSKYTFHQNNEDSEQTVPATSQSFLPNYIRPEGEDSFFSSFMMSVDWRSIDPMNPPPPDVDNRVFPTSNRSASQTTGSNSITPQSSQSWIRPESEEPPQRQSENIPVPGPENDPELDDTPRRTRFRIEEPDDRNSRDSRREQNRPALTTFQELFRQVQGLQPNPQQVNDDMATGVSF